ncbi:MAG: ATP phosphoribosyltransferase regulatory subunit, partial [Clostridiales bacterium]|nr:ATP phosphoribosyltransferase regulatory subunit [Clostridiales bacterium]
MKRYAKLTPEGSRDFLFEECDNRNSLESTLSEMYKEKSYREVITPAIEYFDVFQNEGNGIDADEMYKLTDNYGRTTVLRPDNTMPIARLVATRLKSEDFPVRLYYNQNIFVKNKSLAGRCNEIAQSGIEFIGDASLNADLEVISMAVEALKRSDLKSFSIELGHAGYFNAVLDKMNISDSDKAEICRLTEAKNYAALNDLLESIGNTHETKILRLLPRLFGGIEIIDNAKKIYSNEQSNSALDYI